MNSVTQMNPVRNVFILNGSVLFTLSMLLVCLMVFCYVVPIHQTDAGWAEALEKVAAGALAITGTVAFVLTAPVSVPATAVAIIGIVGCGAGGALVGLGVGEALETLFEDKSSSLLPSALSHLNCYV